MALRPKSSTEHKARVPSIRVGGRSRGSRANDVVVTKASDRTHELDVKLDITLDPTFSASNAPAIAN